MTDQNILPTDPLNPAAVKLLTRPMMPAQIIPAFQRFISKAEYVVVDAEIQKVIPPKKGELPLKSDGSQYEICRSWTAFDDMGISCLGFRASTGQQLAILYPFNKDFAIAFCKLVMGSRLPIAAFNGIQFDNQLFEANGLSLRAGYDVYLEICLAAYGYLHGRRGRPKDHHYNLKTLAEHNFGRGKLADGGQMAPMWWQDGEYEKLANYCLDDCLLEAQLTARGLRRELINPNTQQPLRPLRPFTQVQWSDYTHPNTSI